MLDDIVAAEEAGIRGRLAYRRRNLSGPVCHLRRRIHPHRPHHFWDQRPAHLSSSSPRRRPRSDGHRSIGPRPHAPRRRSQSSATHGRNLGHPIPSAARPPSRVPHHRQNHSARRTSSGPRRVTLRRCTDRRTHRRPRHGLRPPPPRLSPLRRTGRRRDYVGRAPPLCPRCRHPCAHRRSHLGRPRQAPHDRPPTHDRQ